MKRFVLILATLVAVGCIVFVTLTWHSEIAPIARIEPDANLVNRGAELAAIGDCSTCHTRPLGKAYSGGYRLPTPFGAIYSSNITPDEETGIGRWSLAAFTRAMRQGIDREGHELYPAFPYDHFTKVRDEDIAAIYAFLMTQPAVKATRPENELKFPLNWRPLLAGWKLLFLKDQRYVADTSHDARWNHGAYLVEGLGHCGACHTPRNSLGAEASGKSLTGGEAEGWSAPALAGAPWSEASLYAYLRTGIDTHHGAAAGPMLPVTSNLGRAADEDVRAIAAYLATKAGPVPPEPKEAPVPSSDAPGAIIFAGACSSCHGPTAPVTISGAPSLALSTAIRSDDPNNVLRIIRAGIRPEHFKAGPLMPSFAPIFQDDQLVTLANYLRARFAPDLQPWKNVAETLKTIHTSGTKS